MSGHRHRIDLYGLAYLVGACMELIGIVMFLRVDPETNALVIRSISAYWMLVIWAAIKAVQGLVIYLRARYPSS